MSIASADIKANLDKPLLTFQFNATSQSTHENEKDFLLPVEELKRRAEAGDPSAQYLIGRAFRQGWFGCIINKNEGEKWIALAKEKIETPAGLCARGVCYEIGICSVVQNQEQAKQYYQKAAEKGYLPAISRLAFILRVESTKMIATNWMQANRQIMTSIIHDKDKMAQALRLLMPCVEANYIEALVIYGDCYRFGYGVEIDDKEALRLYTAAANLGDAYTRDHLGWRYELQINIAEARKWYTLAAAQGFESAQKALVKLGPEPKPSCCTLM